jgi:hypothetical protein
MAIQRPGRPATRTGQPAVKPSAKSATGRATAIRPATAPVQKQAPATSRGGKGATTRSVPPAAGARPAARPAAPKSNMPMMIGIGAGALVLLVIAFVVMGGKSEKAAPPAPEKASKSKPVDVSSLERDGMAKCNEGLALIQKNQSSMGNHSSLTPAQKQSMMADLEKGKKLISEGMGLLTQANEKSKNTYDTKQYQEALITVRKKLMELRE